MWILAALVAMPAPPPSATGSPTFRLDGDARFADISADGRRVVFESNASNLVKPALRATCPAGRRNGDFGPIVSGVCQHIYVRDMAVGRTTLVAAGGHPLISGDGRYVAFEGGADLVRGDTQMCSGEGLQGRVTYNCSDVFVRDLASRLIERVSLLPDRSQPKSNSHLTWISPDGSLVAFGVEVPGDQSRLYVWDRSRGQSVQVPGATGAASLSSSGRYVVFNGYDKSLVPGDRRDCGLSNRQDIILLDRSAGTRTLVSKTFNGKAPNGPSFAVPSISANGGRVAFWSEATNLLPGNPKTYPQGAGPDVYVYDASKGTLSLVSIALSGGFGNGFSGQPRITPDGRFVAFFSDANDLVPDDRDRPGEPHLNLKIGDVFVRDLRLGETIRVSVSSAGEQGNNISTCCGDAPAISANGSIVAFSSAASNLDPGNESQGGVFVHDVNRHTTVLASVPVTASRGRNSIVADGGSGRLMLLVLGLVLVPLIALAIAWGRRSGRRPSTPSTAEPQETAKL